MAYTKTTWVDGGPPGISASNLNKIEQGIYEAHQQKVSKSGDTMTGELKLEGQHVVIKRPSTSGGWARGLDLRSGDDTSTREAGIGFYGSGQNPPHTIYLGFGNSPWTGDRGVLITEDGDLTARVVKPTQYLQLPVLSSDPSSPPNGAIWMRS